METKPTQLELLPYELLDDEGYPTNEYLDFIKNFVPDETITVLGFVESVLIYGWREADFGFILRPKYRGKIKLELHTGEWSGNEDIINVLLSNTWLSCCEMKYVKWEIGGHYYFEINTTYQWTKV